MLNTFLHYYRGVVCAACDNPRSNSVCEASVAAGQKKVIVRPFAGTVLSGYLPTSGFVAAPDVTLMDTAGRLISIALKEIKWIAYVRDFNLSEVDPERLGRRTYLSRPRGDGLWVRISLVDGDVMEGLAASTLGFVDDLLEDHGVSVTPPEIRSNTQRLYIPRSAIRDLEFVAVITTAARRKALDKPVEERQPGLFEDR